MLGYPEYPTISDGLIKERAEKHNIGSFKFAKMLVLLARDVHIFEENTFFLAELESMGLKLTRVKPKEDLAMKALFTLEDAKKFNRCRICRQSVKSLQVGNPLIINYGKEYAHSKCLLKMKG